MKKVLATAVALCLTGAVIHPAHAAYELSEKEMTPKLQELIAKYNAAKPEALPSTPNIKEFVAESKTDVGTQQSKLTALLNERGYLKGTKYAVDAQNYATNARKELDDLAPVENYPQSIAVARANLPLLIQILENLPPLDEFPFKCFHYEGTKITGIIEPGPARNWRFYKEPYGPNDYVDFLSEINDVGLINSGSEIVVSRTPNGMIQHGWLGKDPKDGREVVACIDHAAKASPSELPEAKKEGRQEEMRQERR